MFRSVLIASLVLLSLTLVYGLPDRHTGALQPEAAEHVTHVLSEVHAAAGSAASITTEARQSPAPRAPLLAQPADISEAGMRAKFEEYKVLNRKVYRRPADEARAFTLFKRNRYKVYALNARVGKKIFSTTGKFAAVDPDEFRSTYFGRRGTAEAPKRKATKTNTAKSPRPRSLVQLGATAQSAAEAQAEFAAQLEAQVAAEQRDGIVMEVDWRSIITPVKDQAKCGSCWAHGSTEALEGAVGFLNKKPTLPLSPQAIMDCRPWTTSPRPSCQGDHETKPFNLWLDTPAVLLQDYAYATNRSAEQVCNKAAPNRGPTLKSWKYVIPKCGAMNCARDENALLDALKTTGPLTVSVHASSFQFYKTSVLPGGDESICSKDPAKVNHVMQIVGYGREGDKPFWLVRNSWGPDWARGGFIHLEFGKNTCGIANEPISLVADPYAN